MKAAVNYIQEVRSELAKVKWPKKTEVVKLTLLVFLLSAILGVYLGALDYAFTRLLELLISN